MQLADNLGGTAMHEACKTGHDRVVEILKQHGAQCVRLQTFWQLF